MPDTSSTLKTITDLVPRWAVAPLRWLSIPFLCVIIAINIVYYFSDVWNDARPSSTRLSGTQIIATYPSILLYSTKPYSITLSRNAGMQQAETILLARTKGLLVEPKQTSVFTFTNNTYQVYGLSIRNNFAEPGPGRLTFSVNESKAPPIEVEFPKEPWLSAIMRSKLVITSPAHGVITILLPLLLMAISLQRAKEQEFAKELFEQVEQDARSFTTDVVNEPAYQYLSARLGYISSKQRDFVQSLRTLTPGDMIKEIQNNTPWKQAYIGRILFSDDADAKRQLIDQDKRKYLLTSEQLKEARKIQWEGFNRPLPTIKYEAGGKFKRGAEFAEQDDINYYLPEAFGCNITEVYRQLNKQKISEQKDPATTQAITIYGAEGSGKTGLLLTLMHGYESDRSAPPLPILVPCEHIAVQQSRQENILRAIGNRLLTIMRDQPKKWASLPSGTQQRLLRYFQRYVSETDFDDFAQNIAKSQITMKRMFGLSDRGLLNVLKELDYAALLLCIDKATPAVDPLDLRMQLEDELGVAVPLAVAYQTAQPTSPPQPGIEVVELKWSRDQLHGLLDYRSHEEGLPPPIYGEVEEKLLGQDGGRDAVIQVPRDLWPWWNALTDPRSDPPADDEVTREQWNKIARYMDAAQQERLSQAQHVLAGCNAWTMQDYERAIEQYVQERPATPFWTKWRLKVKANIRAFRQG